MGLSSLITRLIILSPDSGKFYLSSRCNLLITFLGGKFYEFIKFGGRAGQRLLKESEIKCY